MGNNKIIQDSFDFSDDDDDDDDDEEKEVTIIPSPIQETSKVFYKTSKYNKTATETIVAASPKMATEEVVYSVPCSSSSSSAAAPAPAPPPPVQAPLPLEALEKKPLPPPPPFGIVLINIKKAAEERHIHCEHHWLDGERTLPYVALSYRWGELDEQMIPATKEYNARIISFQLQDFFKLCRAMLHEPDLRHIPYVWVDAICVNQDNLEKRKATIYRMNDIYIQAAAIVAVPDLNAFHLATTTTANNDYMATVKRYRPYLYYLLMGTPEAQQTLVDMDHAWMDDLGIPPINAHRRDLVQSSQQQYRKQRQHQQKRSNSDASQKNTNSGALVAPTNNNNNNDHSFIQQMMALMVIPPPSSSQLQNNGDEQEDVHAKAQHYQQLTCRMMVEFQRFEWQQKLDQRKTDIIQSMKFLQSLMEDWSNRAWVISEYHIAKRKNGKLKFWYNQLSCPELHGLRFFEFDFGKQLQPSSSSSRRQRRPTTTTTTTTENNNDGDDQDDGGDGDGERDFSTISRDEHPFTNQIIYLSRKFKGSMRRRLTKRSVLEMMLQTKASKHIDRFYSIIPLAPKYKHHIKDRNSIAQLGISTMLSVHLKLMEWMETKDRLNLLYCMRQPPASPFPFLPTFATRFKAVKAGLVKLIVRHPHLCNFNLHGGGGDDDDVRLVRPMSMTTTCTINGNNGNDDDDDGDDGDGDNEEQQQGREELWLCPRVYHAPPSTRKSQPVNRNLYERMGGKSHKLWQELGLDPTKDVLDAVSIPLFTTQNGEDDKKELVAVDTATKSLLASDIQLVGSWEKNIWLLYQFCSNYKNGKIHPSSVCPMDKQQLPKGFRIY